YQAPRNEYGQADLRGVWNFSSDVPLQRPKATPDKHFQTREDIEKSNAARAKQLEQLTQQGVGAHNTFWLDYASQAENLRTSLIVYPADGRMPTLVDGVTRIGGFAAAFKDVPGARPVRFGFGGIGKDGPEDRGLFERCILTDIGPPLAPGFDTNYLQIFQGRDHVVILHEAIHDARTIFFDGRPPLDEELRGWTGYSRGHWEGDTLVIETRNFNGLTQSFDSAGTSYDKVVTERLTRTADNVLEYEATLVDPKTFQDRFTLVFPMAKTDKRIYEFACHEGNYSMEIILSGARKEEADALQAKQ
ncbi:MAG: hypothetical protein ACREXP_29545, partial [Steroidobacteraceae bacterium]